MAPSWEWENGMMENVEGGKTVAGQQERRLMR